MVRETALSPADLIYPLFVKPGDGAARRDHVDARRSSSSRSISFLPRSTSSRALGVPAVILFGLPSSKDAVGSEAYDPDGIVQRAIRAIKAHDPDFYVITDVCMCEYTDHGHCGILDDDGCVINDVTLELLARRPSRTPRRARTWSPRAT